MDTNPKLIDLAATLGQEDSRMPHPVLEHILGAHMATGVEQPVIHLTPGDKGCFAKALLSSPLPPHSSGQRRNSKRG